MSDPYLWTKWLHILSSTVLFGTGIGTAFQMVWAMRAQHTPTIARVASGVVFADWLFTLPSGLVQPVTGVILAYLAGYPLSAPWLVTTYALYALAFACWVPVVRLQIRIRDLALANSNDPTPPVEITHAYRFWFALGWPAFAALLVIFWLMIAKPDLWG